MQAMSVTMLQSVVGSIDLNPGGMSSKRFFFFILVSLLVFILWYVTRACVPG